MSDRIKVALHSNFSQAKTGFGSNMRNILRRLHDDPDIEVVEFANGLSLGTEIRTPWRAYGTFPSDPRVLQEIQGDGHKERMASYGMFTIDELIALEKPDIYIGIEDIWAFDIAKRPWFGKIKTVLWTTLDSLPILDVAYNLAPKVDKFLVWASFAEKEMKKRGYDVETVHGAIDYSAYHPLENREELRKSFDLNDKFVVGFVFKNQLRKSVPNLLEGFKRFQKNAPQARLILHTDWANTEGGWDILKYLQEKNIDQSLVLATYICKSCRKYLIKKYEGENGECPFCQNKDSLATKNNSFGVTEEQLNEIYNLMDVYCHPFTSGGQELPIQEAKAAGLITLVTEYSCGIDSCYEKDGGIPLHWAEYREPYTQFIKATTHPESIEEGLKRVYEMPSAEKERLSKNSLKCVANKFSLKKTIGRLREIILSLGKTDWDFDFTKKRANIFYSPPENLSNEEWAIDIFKNMFGKTFSEKDIEIKSAIELIEKDGRESVRNYLASCGNNLNEEISKKEFSLEDFFDGEEEKRIAVVMPESAGDVLMVNSLIENLKKVYPEYNIYFVTQPQFFPMIDDNPFVHKIIPYSAGMDNLLFWEGRGNYKGLVDIAFLPFIETQRILGQLHNGSDRDGLNIFAVGEFHE